jgi:hypothetical protein
MFEKLVQVFERLLLALIILTLLPCLLPAIIHAIGTINLLLIFGILCAIAYLRGGSRIPSAGGRRMISGSERTPRAPKETH